jgi:hypothetical protein
LVIDKQTTANEEVSGGDGRASLLASNATLHEDSTREAAGGRRVLQGSGTLYPTWDQTKLELMYLVSDIGLRFISFSNMR